MKTRLAAPWALLIVIVLAIGSPASAHRLDEYLQATTISLEQDHIQAQMRLTPGVAVFPSLFANMDTDGDGVLSQSEQQAYVERALGDLSLTVNENRLRLRLVSWKFAQTTEMKEGRGDIQIEFAAVVPRTTWSRKLVFENHHQSQIAVYLVNCLVPSDPNIQVKAQKRNYLQSRYELDYVQAGVDSGQLTSDRWSGVWRWLGMTTLILLLPLAWLWRRVRSGMSAVSQKEGVSTHNTLSPEGRSV